MSTTDLLAESTPPTHVLIPKFFFIAIFAFSVGMEPLKDVEFVSVIRHISKIWLNRIRQLND